MIEKLPDPSAKPSHRFWAAFPNVPLVVLVALFLGYNLVWWMLVPCSPTLPYFSGALGALVTATVFIALWSNHLNMGSVKNWRDGAHLLWLTTGNLLRFFMLALFFCLPSFVAMPSYGCYEERLRASSFLAYSTSIKLEIQKRAEKQKSLMNTGINLAGPDELAKLAHTRISLDGVITVIGKEVPVVLVLTPRWNTATERVQWNCFGTPTKDVPPPCRSASLFE